MLRLVGGRVESLWDEVLPGEVRALRDDLRVLDELLSDPELVAPIAASWQEQARAYGRPTISMATYVRLMVVKHRPGCWHETLASCWRRSARTRAGSGIARGRSAAGCGR